MTQALKIFPRLTDENDISSLDEKFPGYCDDQRAWQDIYREILVSVGSAPTLEAFLHGLDLRSKEPPADPSSITLMTIAASKGKEFDHVYVMGLVEDQLPSFQSKKAGDQSPEMEEERRNCFVAITRAKETLTLTYAQRYFGWPKQPSRFLTEMGLIPQ